MKTKRCLIVILIMVAALFFFQIDRSEAQCSVLGGAGSPESNTKTQCAGNIATDLCPSCPGFNPQNLLKHVDPATGSREPYFSRTGPGALTDNMFGIVSGTDPGSNGVSGDGDDISTSRCGITEGTPANGLPGLNCGDLRFDPSSQGMSIPRLATGLNNAALPFTSSMPSEADFCNQSGNDCVVTGTQKTEAHLGLRLSNVFQWANVAAPPPPSVNLTSSRQEEKQVVSLTAGRTDATFPQSGSLDSPGSGDQVAVFTTSWSTTNTNESFSAPEVQWAQTVTEPLPFEGAGGSFSIESSSSFTYQNQPRDIDPVTLHDRLIPVVSYPAGPIGSGTTIP